MKYIITFAFGFYLGRRFYQNEQKLKGKESFKKIEQILDSLKTTKPKEPDNLLISGKGTY